MEDQMEGRADVPARTGFDDGVLAELDKRPEPEAIGADGLPIKIGDTVYLESFGRPFTVCRVCGSRGSVVGSCGEQPGCLNPWDPQSKRVFDQRGPYQTLYAHGSGGHDDGAVLAFDTTQITSPANGCNPQYGDPCHPLCARAHVPAIAFKYHAGAKAGSAAVCDDGTTPTLTADYLVRRLTPIECERLQGFQDDWTRIPYRGKPAEECPDTPRYKAIGNSMAVPVMRWIGERIAMVDALGGPI